MKMKKESKLWLWVGDEWLKKVSKDQKGEGKELSFVAGSFQFLILICERREEKGLNVERCFLIFTDFPYFFFLYLIFWFWTFPLSISQVNLNISTIITDYRGAESHTQIVKAPLYSLLFFVRALSQSHRSWLCLRLRW